MKTYSKIILASLLAVTMCGCDFKGTGSRPTGVSSGSGSTVQSNPPLSIGTPEDIAPPPVDKTISENTTVSAGETLSVKKGETLYINDGAELTVDGTIECADGGAIKIQSGGNLLLNGKIALEGNMELGGFLGIREQGEINGSGTLRVLDSFDDINCEGTCKAKIAPPALKNIDGCTYIGGVLIANKKYSLPETYGDGLTDDTYNALLEMRKDSGFPMEILSGFRSYADQVVIFQNWCDISGYEEAIRFSSAPGHSEHQTGLTMDITDTGDDYGETDEGKWLGENCYKYGFIIRYPEGMEHITGYIYEPWHVRYLGKSTAKLVHDSGLTLEEFLGVEGM